MTQPHPTEQTWRIFARKSGGRSVVLLDTSSKTAAALRHKMLPCFVLRPPRSSARPHSFAKAARAFTRIAFAVALAQCENCPTCPRPREIRRGDASSPHLKTTTCFTKFTRRDNIRICPWGRSIRVQFRHKHHRAHSINLFWLVCAFCCFFYRVLNDA